MEDITEEDIMTVHKDGKHFLFFILEWGLFKEAAIYARYIASNDRDVCDH
jgi:hypothetical protein